MDVLVVDEDTAFAKVAVHALSRDGHQVVTAKSGDEALSLIANSTPKLVLIDLMLSGVNGLQLLLVLKSDSATSGIPVIVWTTTVSEDIAKQALAFGADAILVKTRFSMGELRRLVGRLMPDATSRRDGAGMRRILIVEDDEGTREAVAKHLGAAGYTVHEADNGWEALMMLDREKFDLIVLDLVMPGMDGQTFLRIMKNAAKYQHIPVVVLTAYDTAEMRMLVEPLGVARVMGKKPPMWDDLLPTVQGVLEPA
ncbi:MAG TPA: response regulator [Tepidisphaeraceae bacterium]|jgi:CheY-like chemotaxis protein|nr:response regulator [Tepidisphaeraceae bacterium]